MRGTDRAIVVVVPLLAIAVAFWFLMIAPKRSESSELQENIDSLNTRIAAADSQIQASELARDNFSKNYGELVSLGRAAPEDSSEQSTLIFDLAGLSKSNSLNFRRFEVVGAAAPGAPEAPPAEPAPPDGEDAPAEPAATPVAAPATEAVASTLPIGATTGPAELPVMPYEFRFLGNFFDMAAFFGDLDDNVSYNRKNGKVSADGRLMTVNGFSLTGDQFTGFPDVEANFSVTTYLVPADQGLEAGATPAGPPPAGSLGDPTTVASTGATP